MPYTFHLMIFLTVISSFDRDARFWNVRWLVYVPELTLSPAIDSFLCCESGEGPFVLAFHF